MFYFTLRNVFSTTVIIVVSPKKEVVSIFDLETK